MPFDSEGVFARIHNWEDDRINDIDIASDRHDEEDDNFASGLSQCLLKSGIVPMSGNLNMSGFNIKNIGDGQSNGDAVNKGQLSSAQSTLQANIDALEASASVFVGDIKASLQSANHGVWLLCDGQAVSRETYADLFAVISTNFGEGDGSTTFNVPDYRGKFLRGLGGDSEADVYTTQAEGLPNITGAFGGGQLMRTDVGAAASGAFQLISGYQNSRPIGESGSTHAVNLDASRSSAIYGASSHVTPINQAINYFIRAKVEA